MSPFWPERFRAAGERRTRSLGVTILSFANVAITNNANEIVALIEFVNQKDEPSNMHKLTNSFPYLLNRVGVRMGELFSRRIEPYGVTLPMYRVMAALSEVPGQRLGDLCVMTTVELSTLSRLIGTMEKMNLVSRSRLEGNARTVAIHLTNEGATLLESLMPIAKHYEDVATSQLSRSAIEALKKTLTDIYNVLDIIEDELPEPTAREKPGKTSRRK